MLVLTSRFARFYMKATPVTAEHFFFTNKFFS